MGSKAPSWTDQWGTDSGSRSFGGEEDGDMLVTKKASSSRSSGGKKMADVKAAVSTGYNKAKAAAAVGAQKVKVGTLVGIKCVKKYYQKRYSS
ncbi:CDP-diacylglycerol-glycerol-3-phosphate 3-phosphatidyltransferase [Melia azedarach]|uniref:CDP-diacylglycerol-glycerol-3-phosphate 3-phosphatidyltransferase n=1 Tax=Melia azedarach TaxID=155640 RepID=A0ACC1Z407_MELAZ|nr:CDP-diacylglycerol-glycerol-3-phosphate 3-phosphatidyltransferase [Melia azedarach]